MLLHSLRHAPCLSQKILRKKPQQDIDPNFVQFGLRRRRSVLLHVRWQLSPSWAKLVGLGGFEPPTSPLSGVRSNQLSYRPGVGKVLAVR
jgi:hypothetical protein